MRTTGQKCQILADKIRLILKDGLWVDQDAIHYMDSTLSDHSAQTLAAVIQDPSNCERDPLIELLYFPDETIQIQLEPFLESAAFVKPDEKTVLKHLIPSLGETRFHFSDNRSIWKIHTPASGASAFLYRLNISNHPDKRLIAAIHSRCQDPYRIRYKVKLRNAGLDMSRKKTNCLESLFSKSDLDDDGFLERFHFLLHFLGEWDDDSTLADALRNKKIQYIKQVQQALRFETLRRDRNMETLMMMGIRWPHLDRQEITKKIVMIDDISLAIFGKTVYVNEFSLS
jgi:hypothetical protein